MIIDELLILYSVSKLLSEQGMFNFTSLHCVHNIQNYHVPCIMCKRDVKLHGLILYNK